MNIPQIIWAESFREEQELAEKQWDGRCPIQFFSCPLQEIPMGEFVENTAVSIRTHSRMTEPLVELISGVVTRSTGYDHIGTNYHGIPVGYLPDYATEAVAEHNLMMGLSLLRRLPASTRAVHRFDRSGLTGQELSSITVGIVGVGRIGRATAERYCSLAGSIIGHDIDDDADWASRVGLEYVELFGLFERSQLVILCLPLYSSTEKLIDRSLLDRLPEGSYLVNSGRGEVVRNQDLLWALKQGPVAGLALDVFNHEHGLGEALRHGSGDGSSESELSAARELLGDPRVIGTPHNAFNTREALARKVQRTLESFQTFDESGEFPSPVNR